MVAISGSRCALAHRMRHAIENWILCGGGAGRNRGSRRRSSKKCRLRICLAENSSVPGFSGGGQSSGPPPPEPCRFFGLRSVAPRPKGRHESHMHGRRLASALLWCRFPAVHRHLQRPPPTQTRPYPSHRQATHEIQVPVHEHGSIHGVSGLEN
jgi:hypothetical protein